MFKGVAKKLKVVLKSVTKVFKCIEQIQGALGCITVP